MFNLSKILNQWWDCVDNIDHWLLNYICLSTHQWSSKYIVQWIKLYKWVVSDDEYIVWDY